MADKNTQPIAAIFMGIQATGKSTFFEKKLSEKFVHINLDTLKTRKREQKKIDECFISRLSFAVDNTNPTKTVRQGYIKRAREEGYRVIGYFFRSVISESITRNGLRERHVPNHAIAHTSNILEIPCLAEGFDELWYVEIDKELGDFRISPWRNSE